ncbi:MAG: GntR family transcriptional regulator [Burkholderiales bacterium]|nr:GntR family transcriptional regulator [Burkholderiales bacterium]
MPAAVPLYAALRERLKADILGGRRAPGAPLPSEAELAAAHAVSRITVRQALADLQREGLVVTRHGKGSFVARPAVAQDLTRLAGLAESMHGAGHAVHTRVLALGRARAGAAIAGALGVAPGAAVIELRTLRYLDRVPLAINRSWLPLEPGARLRRDDLASRDVLDICENLLGIAIGHAEVSIGASAATARQASALGVAAGAPLVAVRRLVFGAEGAPLHLEHSVYRADRFAYRARLERGRTGAARSAAQMR